MSVDSIASAISEAEQYLAKLQCAPLVELSVCDVKSLVFRDGKITVLSKGQSDQTFRFLASLEPAKMIELARSIPAFIDRCKQIETEHGNEVFRIAANIRQALSPRFVYPKPDGWEFVFRSADACGPGVSRSHGVNEPMTLGSIAQSQKNL